MITALVVGLPGCRSAPRPGADAEESRLYPAAVRSPGARMALFNGKDLSGWYPWLVDSGRSDPRRVFSVTNGWLRISGDGLGYLATEASYRDYRLVLEYRWGMVNTRWGGRLRKARDAGVFLHAQGPDGNSHDGGGAFRAAIECNVFEGATGDFLLIRGNAADGTLIAPWIEAEVAAERDAEGWYWWQPGGRRQRLERMGRLNWRHRSGGWRDVTGFRGERDVERPAPQWNRLEIKAAGGRIDVWLNGVQVNSVLRSWPEEGPILLQCEGSEIFYRRVELRPAGGRAPSPR